MPGGCSGGACGGGVGCGQGNGGLAYLSGATQTRTVGGNTISAPLGGVYNGGTICNDYPIRGCSVPNGGWMGGPGISALTMANGLPMPLRSLTATTQGALVGTNNTQVTQDFSLSQGREGNNGRFALGDTITSPIVNGDVASISFQQIGAPARNNFDFRPMTCVPFGSEVKCFYAPPPTSNASATAAIGNQNGLNVLVGNVNQANVDTLIRTTGNGDTLPNTNLTFRTNTMPLLFQAPPPRTEATIDTTTPLPYSVWFCSSFNDVTIGFCNTNTFFFLTDGDRWIANDGKVAATDYGLQMVARPFTVGWPCIDITNVFPNENGWRNNFKSTLICNNDWPIPTNGYDELYLETCMCARTFGFNNSPGGRVVLDSVFPNAIGSVPELDPRLAFGMFGVIDFNSGMVLGWMMTNLGLFTFEWMLPLECFVDNNEQGSANWIGMHLIQCRDNVSPLKDFWVMGIGICQPRVNFYLQQPPKDSSILSIYMNGSTNTRPVPPQSVWKIDNFGQILSPDDMYVKHPGHAALLRAPRCVSALFSLGDCLDGVSPPASLCGIPNGLLGLTKLSNFDYQVIRQSPEAGTGGTVTFVHPVPLAEYRLWGQGAALIAGYLRVECRS